MRQTDHTREAYISTLRGLIPGFQEERLVSMPIMRVGSDDIPYDDPRWQEGFVSEADRTFDIVISDETPDSHGTVFLSDKWDLSLREMGKRYVTHGHPWVGDPDPNVVIGTGVERVEGKQLVSTFRAEPYGTNATADAAVVKLHYGSYTDASVEAYVRDGYSGKEQRDEDLFYFCDHLLITYGIVMRGSNPSAMKRSTDRAMDSIAQSRLDITTDTADLIAMQRLQKRVYGRRMRYRHHRR